MLVISTSIGINEELSKKDTNRNQGVIGTEGAFLAYGLAVLISGALVMAYYIKHPLAGIHDAVVAF